MNFHRLRDRGSGEEDKRQGCKHKFCCIKIKKRAEGQ